MVNVRGISLYVLLVILRSRASLSRIEWLRRMQAARERRMVVFRRIQAQQRFFFAILTSILVYRNTHSVERNIWMQERSGVWWDRIVSQCFNVCDWLENFRMSKSTSARS